MRHRTLPPDPAARPAATRGVTGQKSAEAIVAVQAGRPKRRRAELVSTRRSHGRLAPLNEPDRGRGRTASCYEASLARGVDDADPGASERAPRMEARESQPGYARGRRDACRGFPGLCPFALARDPPAACRWHLSTPAGQTGFDPQAERGRARAG